MPDIVITILLLFCLLQIKHLFADFFLQTRRMLEGRHVYLHVGRAQHAGVHTLLSIPVFVVFGTGLGLLIALIVAEWVVHFHLDWAKARYNKARALHPSQALFWHAFGVDQALHQLTYIVMVWAWVFYVT